MTFFRRAASLPNTKKNLSKPSLSQECVSPPPPVPLTEGLVESLIAQLIKTNASTTKGIFRLSANHETIVSSISLLKQQKYDQLPEDPHLIAGLLKFVLTSQQEPVVPFSNYEEVVSLVPNDSSQVEIAQLSDTIRHIPDTNLHIIQMICSFLQLVSAEESNQMDATNCAIVFGAIFLRPQVVDENYLKNIRKQAIAVENLIIHYKEIFVDNNPPTPGLSKEEQIEGNQPSLDPSENPDLIELEHVSEERINHSFKSKHISFASYTSCSNCTKPIFSLLLKKSKVCTVCKRSFHVKCAHDEGVSCIPESSGARILVGDRAPIFVGTSSRGEEVSLQALLDQGKTVCLFFYPMSFSPACIVENTTFKRQFDLFKYADCEVIGVSRDTPSCHRQFANKFKLPFHLISDQDGYIRNLFGVRNFFNGVVPGRVTFLINKKGIVTFVHTSMMKPEEHANATLKALTATLLESNLLPHMD